MIKFNVYQADLLEDGKMSYQLIASFNSYDEASAKADEDSRWDVMAYCDEEVEYDEFAGDYDEYDEEE